MQTSELFKAWFLHYLLSMSLFLPNSAHVSSTVEVSGWKWIPWFMQWGPTPALPGRKSTPGSSSVPPRVSYSEHKPNSIKPILRQGILWGCFPSYRTNMRDSGVKNRWCFGASECLVGRWVLLSIQGDAWACGGGESFWAVTWAVVWASPRVWVALLAWALVNVTVTVSPAAKPLQRGKRRRRKCCFDILMERE